VPVRVGAEMGQRDGPQTSLIPLGNLLGPKDRISTLHREYQPHWRSRGGILPCPKAGFQLRDVPDPGDLPLPDQGLIVGQVGPGNRVGRLAGPSRVCRIRPRGLDTAHERGHHDSHPSGPHLRQGNRHRPLLGNQGSMPPPQGILVRGTGDCPSLPFPQHLHGLGEVPAERQRIGCHVQVAVDDQEVSVRHCRSPSRGTSFGKSDARIHYPRFRSISQADCRLETPAQLPEGRDVCGRTGRCSKCSISQAHHASILVRQAWATSAPRRSASLSSGPPGVERRTLP